MRLERATGEQILGRLYPTPFGVEGVIVDYTEQSDCVIDTLTLRMPEGVEDFAFMILNMTNHAYSLHRVH